MRPIRVLSALLPALLTVLSASAGDDDLGTCAGYLPGSITSAGSFPWEPLGFEGPDEGDCIISGLVFQAGDSSVAELTLTGPGVLSFQWYVSSRQDDGWLSCEIARGGATSEVGGISGVDEVWRPMEVFIPQGECRVRWIYRKESASGDGEDAGRVAAVGFEPLAAAAQDFDAWKAANGVTGDEVMAPNGLRYDTCWLMAVAPDQPVPAGLNQPIPAEGGGIRYRVRHSLSATGLLGTRHSADLSDWSGLGMRVEQVAGSLTADSVEFDHYVPDSGGVKFLRSEHVAQVSPPEGFVYVGAGTFLRSSPAGELGRWSGMENYQHEVTLTRGYFVKRHETTYAEWNLTRDWARANGYPDLGYKTITIDDEPTVVEMGASGGRYLLEEEGGDFTDAAPSLNGEADQPVSGVSWYEVIKWLNANSEREGLSPCYFIRQGSEELLVWRNQPLESVTDIVCDWEADGYRLPTEAEWEYACRGGTTSALSNGLDLTYGVGQDDPLDPNVDPIAWYWQNGAASHPVGQKEPNPLGLFDMHGNIQEWCWDRYDDTRITQFSQGVAQTDPRGEPVRGIYRSMRGGSWRNSGRNVRSAARDRQVPTLQGGYNVGFRMTRTAPE